MPERPRRTRRGLVRRVAEFLNRELRNVEVLAVEYSVWQDEGGLRVLIPTVHGRTIHPDEGGSSAPRVWTLDDWMAWFEEANGTAVANGLRLLADRWQRHDSPGVRAVAAPGVGNEVALSMYLEDSTGRWAPALRVARRRLVLPISTIEKRAWIDADALTRYQHRLEAVDEHSVVTSGGNLRLPITVLGDDDQVSAIAQAMDEWANDLRKAW